MSDDPVSDEETADAERVARNQARQRELYGEPLGVRIRRVTSGLGITQAALSRTLGMSPAMLSQLVSGRRVKIGDPAVLARLMVLDDRCAAGPVGVAEARVLLEDVRDARPGWAGGSLVVAVSDPGPGAGAPVPAAEAGSAGRAAAAAPPEPRAATRRLVAVPDLAREPAGAGAVPRPRGTAEAVRHPSGGPRPAERARPGRGEPPAAARTAADALRAITGPARLVAAAATLETAFPELADVLRRAAVAGR